MSRFCWAPISGLASTFFVCPTTSCFGPASLGLFLTRLEQSYQQLDDFLLCVIRVQGSTVAYTVHHPETWRLISGPMVEIRGT